MERRSFVYIKFELSRLPRSVFRRLNISMVLTDFFAISFKWNLFLKLQW